MSEFELLGIQQWLSRQCTYMALHTPTPIQRLCIPAILSGKHVVGGAETGSGKTAAFALPLLQILAEDLYGVFALVLTPSRELAYQIVDQFVALGAPLQVRTALIIGGVPHEQQLDALSARPHIVVATPGRLRFVLSKFPEAQRAFSRLRFLVLDEADRLTSGDMEADAAAVVELLGPARSTRRTLLFTATLEPRLTRLDMPTDETDEKRGTKNEEEEEEEESAGTELLLPLLGITDATTLEVFATNTVQLPNASAPSHSVAETLQQKYIFIPNMVKLAYLVAALRGAGSEQSTIVFTNSCMRCEVVRLALQLLGFPVCSLNSIISQKHRLDNLATFKLGISRILVATDIASRGLDIPAVGMVLHYDLPKEPATYIHRVGRTARAQRDGLSVAFVTEYDVKLVRRIEKRVGCTMALWKAASVAEHRVLKLLDEVSAAKVQAQLQVEEQFGRRVGTLKEHAAMKKAERRAARAEATAVAIINPERAKKRCRDENEKEAHPTAAINEKVRTKALSPLKNRAKEKNRVKGNLKAVKKS